MTLNKTSIEWCDRTWNPVTGCKHGCPYCYARKIAERFRGTKAWPNGFEPTCHEDRWGDPFTVKKPQTIFVCSMADLFGEWVPPSWIWPVFTSCDDAPQHTYIFLTKNPVKMARYSPRPSDQPRGVRINWWFGASVTCREDTRRIDNLQNRVLGSNRFVSFEPLLGDPGPLDLSGIRQVIIGAQTNPDRYVGLEWVLKICEAADRAGAKVFMKDSMAGRWPDRELRRELCWQVRK